MFFSPENAAVPRDSPLNKSKPSPSQPADVSRYVYEDENTSRNDRYRVGGDGKSSPGWPWGCRLVGRGRTGCRGGGRSCHCEFGGYSRYLRRRATSSRRCASAGPCRGRAAARRPSSRARRGAPRASLRGATACPLLPSSGCCPPARRGALRQGLLPPSLPSSPPPRSRTSSWTWSRLECRCELRSVSDHDSRSNSHSNPRLSAGFSLAADQWQRQSRSGPAPSATRPISPATSPTRTRRLYRPGSNRGG